ncbi:MAG: hypothetical protein J6K32_03010 [Clostridia bacterium]|nr:hypothetical protein [Clostridia bacterium]
MKKTAIMGLLALCLWLLCASACAQTLPGLDCFSPGLVLLDEKEGAPVHAQAQISIGKAMYARDTSVLSSMLEGTAFLYDGEPGADRLTLVRDGQTLFTGALAAGGEDAVLQINDGAYAFGSVGEALAALPGGAAAALLPQEDPMGGLPPLERVPLERVAAYIEGLREGDEIAAGYCVAQAFTVARTRSDDGTRLTKIEISGSVAREGGAPWVISGFLRQPAGRSPKDTFELTAVQDEQNTLELLYSSLRESTVTRKDAAGETSVDTTLKLAGRLGGYSLSSRLRVKQTNRWTAGEDGLSEKITVSTTFGHTDKTPGRRMLCLNDISAEMKQTISLTTKETDDAVSLHDGMTLSITLDGNSFLEAGAQIDMTVGADAPGIAQAMPQPGEGSAQEAAAQAVRSLSRMVYPMLDEDTHDKIEKGL